MPTLSPENVELLTVGLRVGAEMVKGVTQYVEGRQSNLRLEEEQKKMALNEQQTKNLEEEINKKNLILKELEMKKQQQESERNSEQQRLAEKLNYEKEKNDLTCEIEANRREIELLRKQRERDAAQIDKAQEQSEELMGKISKLHENTITLHRENEVISANAQIRALQLKMEGERNLGTLNMSHVRVEEQIINALFNSLRDSFGHVRAIGSSMELVPLLQSRLRQTHEGNTRTGTRYLFVLIPLAVLFLTLLSSSPMAALLFCAIVSLTALCVLTGYIEWPTRQNTADIVSTRINELLIRIENAKSHDTANPLRVARGILSQRCEQSIQAALQEKGRVLQELQTSALAVRSGVIDQAKVTSLEQSFIASHEFLNMYENQSFNLSSTQPKDSFDIDEHPHEAREAIASSE